MKKIICWNVNGIRAWSKKGCLDWVLSQNPDIFCFQETKAHPDQLDSSLLNIDGYRSYFDHSKVKKGYSGVVVYTKEIPETVDTDLMVEVSDSSKATQIDQEGRFIALYFKKFVFINCYFPNGGGDVSRLEYKLRFYKAFKKYITKLKDEGKKIVFCGDLNVAHTEIDIARPKENSNHVGFLPIEREWLSSVIEEGFIDTFRFKNPEARDAYSWWDVKSGARNRNIGWRIDYFLVDKTQDKKIIEAKIHQDIYGSDHCPISLEIDL
ncbi:MAG: exodeoxyribonuclease III [Candidatus Pacebacteria bacterium]|nr:exodeoxyribonuclease III [Candidatus Paceibacterota bacterium]